MPKVKYISAPDLGAFIIGTAVTRKVSETEICEKLGVSRTTYARWKKDLASNLSFSQLITLCRMLNITKRDIITFVPLPEGNNE